jgi:DNA-binding MarR family transcriptional regulator
MSKEDNIQTVVEIIAKLQKPALNSGWKQWQLSHAQLGMLYLLSKHSNSSVKEASNFLGVSKSAVTQLTEPLERKGLISRQNDPRDRRIVRLALTPKGSDLLKKLARYKFDGIRSAIGTLDNHDIKLLCELLKKADTGFLPADNERRAERPAK